MNLDEIKKLPIKGKAEALYEIAKTGEALASLEFGKVIADDKLKIGDEKAFAKDKLKAHKAHLRSQCLPVLLQAAKSGCSEATQLGLDIAFSGRKTAFKTIISTDYSMAEAFSDVMLTQDLDAPSKAHALFKKSLCLLHKRYPDGESRNMPAIVELWRQAAALEGVDSELASIQLAGWLFDNDQYEEAVPLLEPLALKYYSATSKLMLIYKNHIKDTAKCDYYLNKCIAMTESR